MTTTRETSFRQILYPNSTGIPEVVLRQAIPVSRLAVFIPNFGGEMLESVYKDLQENANKVLEMTPLDVLLEGWKKYREVTAALADSTKKPGEPLTVPLVKHKIKSEHHPYIELLVEEVPQWKIEFKITVTLEVEGAQLKIQNGQIIKIVSGTAVGAFEIALNGHTLAESKTGKFNLPGEIHLRPEAPALPRKAVPGGAHLSARNGEIAGRNFSLTDGLSIGRSSDCDIKLADPTISRHHAQLRYAEQRWYLQDAHSDLGVAVNGSRVSATALHHGDLIAIGNYEFIFHER